METYLDFNAPPYLDSDTFDSLHRFGKFVAHALSQRDSLTEVSTLTLKFKGSLTRPFATDIVNYAYLINLKQLTIWHNGTTHELPQCLFVSRTLKHLTLVNPFSSCRSCTPNSAWDFPALETLNLMCIRLGDGSEKNLNPFYKCVNLKDVTLHECSMKGLEVFNVCAPHLSSFTITEASVLPKVLNMVTPRLETLTASESVAICSEGLAASSNFLRLYLEGCHALEKVNISMSNSRLKKERHVPSLLDLFRMLRTVKFLILDVDVIESLSSCLDQLSGEPCPFDNLRCLKIDTTLRKQRDCIPTIHSQVRNYLLENSPNATFIMDIPQVFVFLSVNAALSVVINSSRSTDDDDLFEVLISSFTYEDEEVEKDVDSGVNIDEEYHFYNHYDEDHHNEYNGGCTSAPNDDGTKNAPHGVDENKDLTQYVHEEDHHHDYDDGCTSAPVDDENKKAPHVVYESKGSKQRVNDDLKRRSEEFIERGKQRWRDDKERDRDEMMNK